MNRLKEYVKKNKKKTFCLLLCSLIILFIINNFYRPVRMSKLFNFRPLGGIDYSLEDKSMIESYSIFYMKNHSIYEQKVTFIVYQDNSYAEDYCLFDINKIYINFNTDSEIVLEDGLVKMKPGEELSVLVSATANDSSIAVPTRSGPVVKIVTIN